jgi:hypothetical protein
MKRKILDTDFEEGENLADRDLEEFQNLARISGIP